MKIYETDSDIEAEVIVDILKECGINAHYEKNAIDENGSSQCRAIAYQVDI